MTTGVERKKAANTWHCIQINFLIDYMKKTKSSLERFETLGDRASDMIESQITELQDLISNYKMK